MFGFEGAAGTWTAWGTNACGLPTLRGGACACPKEESFCTNSQELHVEIISMTRSFPIGSHDFLEFNIGTCVTEYVWLS
jgi:hypothetical protein